MKTDSGKSRQHKDTRIELVAELEALERNDLADIIAEAKAGEFHDYKNEKYVCGKLELVNQLRRKGGLDDIVSQVMRGDYDEKPDAEDREMLNGLIKELTHGVDKRRRRNGGH